MSKTKSFFAQMFNKLLETLSRFSLKMHSKEEFPTRACINEINAIVSCFPDEERRLLPVSLVEYFAERADLPPSKVLDMSKPLEQQSFSDETLLFMFYINMIFEEIEKSSAATEEEIQNVQVHATKKFIMMLDSMAIKYGRLEFGCFDNVSPELLCDEDEKRKKQNEKGDGI